MKNSRNNIPALLLIIFSLSFHIRSSAQVKNEKQRILRVGKQMPNVAIPELINYKSRSANISDFKGKLLILDFWATYCAPCIAMFPKTHALERQFNGKIQFLPVTKESVQKTKEFFTRMNNIRQLNPASVVNDTVLNRLFYPPSLPFYVWIDAKGKIIATTGAEEITEKNISSVLNSNIVPFKNRPDIRMKALEWETSAFALDIRHKQMDTTGRRIEIPKQNLLSYSVASKYLEGTEGIIAFNPSKFTAVNISLAMLYRWYYNLGYYGEPVWGAFNSKLKHEYRISDPNILKQLTLPDSIAIRPGTIEMLNWMKKYWVCYEISYPKDLSWKENMDLFKQDIDRYFAKRIGFSTHVEERIDSNANVLRLIGSSANLLTSGGKPQEKHDRYSYFQRNLPLSQLIGVLRGYFFQQSKATFADKTDFTKKIDLELNCDMTSVSSINTALKQYGLKFATEIDKTDVLVFSDSN